jgi:hypothetical protein
VRSRSLPVSAARALLLFGLLGTLPATPSDACEIHLAIGHASCRHAAAAVRGGVSASICVAAGPCRWAAVGNHGPVVFILPLINLGLRRKAKAARQQSGAMRFMGIQR